MTEHVRKYHNGQYNLETDKEHYFVFGSNTRGIHGAGAARFAFDNLGALWGQGAGFQGNCYAIPTKDWHIQTLPLAKIKEYVQFFVSQAHVYNEATFFVTAIGTGLAGYKHKDIAPLFKDAPNNCIFPPEWKEYLE